MEQRLYDAVSWLFMGTTHTVPERETSREYLFKHEGLPRRGSGGAGCACEPVDRLRLRAR